jgi:hypothetical protein
MPATQAMRDWVIQVLGVQLQSSAQESTAAAGAAQARSAADGRNAGQLSAELAALTRRIPEASTADPEVKDELMRLAAAATASLKAQDLKQASQSIAQLREALRDALDAAGIGVGRVTPPQPADLTRQLGPLIRQIAVASGDDAAMRASLAEIATEAQAAIKANDLEAAVAAIARLRAGLSPPADAAPVDHLAASAARGQEAAAANVRGIAYPKLLLRWRSAQTAAISALDNIGKTILAMPDVAADARLPRVQEVIARLPTLIPAFGTELEGLLDRGINAGTDAGIAKEALACVGKYRQAISSAAKLSSFERFAKQQVGDLAVVQTLDSALTEIAQNLEQSP